MIRLDMETGFINNHEIVIQMEELDMRGQIMKCIECTHCDVKEMRCFPKSEDCEKEYDLTEQDLYTKAKCDFAEKK